MVTEAGITELTLYLHNKYFFDNVTPFFIPNKNNVYGFPKWDNPLVGFPDDEYETANVNIYRNLKSSTTFVTNN